MSLEAGKDLKEIKDLARKALKMLLSKARSSERGAGRRGGAGKGFLLALLLLVPLLLQQPLALAQPYPVEVSVFAFPREDRLDYSILVEAKRDVAVIVEVAVYVPGQGWGRWTKLWEGHLSAGESKWVDGKDERKPTEPGYYVIWTSVQYLSSNDYQMIGGSRYYAGYNYVSVRNEPAVKAWQECNALKLNYSLLKLDYSQLKGKYEALKDECFLLNVSYKSLRNDYEWLNSTYRRLASDFRRLETQCWYLNASYMQLKDDYSALQDSYRQLEDKLGFYRSAGLAALVFAVAAAALALEGWRRALSLAKRLGSAGGG